MVAMVILHVANETDGDVLYMTMTSPTFNIVELEFIAS